MALAVLTFSEGFESMEVNSNLVKNSVMLVDDDLGDIFGMLTLYAIQSEKVVRVPASS